VQILQGRTAAKDSLSKPYPCPLVQVIQNYPLYICDYFLQWLGRINDVAILHALYELEISPPLASAFLQRAGASSKIQRSGLGINLLIHRAIHIGPP